MVYARTWEICAQQREEFTHTVLKHIQISHTLSVLMEYIRHTGGELVL